MNQDFSRWLQSATQLTQGGQLQEATQHIQRALGEAFAASGLASGLSPDAHAPAPQTRQAPGDVIDVPSRVVGVDASTVSPTPPHADDATGERFTTRSFNHAGRTLAYKLFVPAQRAGEPAGPRPLVLMLHGCTQNADDFARGTRMNQLAREQGFVVLYPEQTQRANAQRCWNWFKPQHQQRGRGEPAVLVALTRSVMAEQSIDPARVYVAGLSAGGAMADILGRAYPDLFAAVGVHSGLAAGAASDIGSALSAMRGVESPNAMPVAGTGAGAGEGEGTGARAPVIVFHGDADATVHPKNGEAVVRAAASARPSAQAAAQVQTGQAGGGRRFTRTTYPAADEPGRALAEHWRLHGSSHAWSGGSSTGSYADEQGVDASREMLRFFMAHPRRPTAH